LSYTTRDVAQILGFSEAQIRSYVRAGFLQPQREEGNRLAFTFPDLVFLRAAKGLEEAGVPAKRVKRSLARLREQLPEGGGLAGVKISAQGDSVVVADAGGIWEADSGQALFDFDAAGKSAPAAQKVTPHAPRALRAVYGADRADREAESDRLFLLATELEASSPDDAAAAYERVLEVDPDRSDALVNLGLLLHESGDAAGAAERYRRALEVDAGDATAAFNLGVALDDLGRAREALDAYRQAIAIDPSSADAHYNASHLCARLGETAAALRHLQEYRKLSGRS
jgi:tetratricopeptide (TPR) repeat protein